MGVADSGGSTCISRPLHWRDAWQLEHVTGKYIISDKPMTEEEWIKQRAVVVDGDDAVDVTPQIEDKPK